MSPDWSAKVDPIPYAKMDDPQSLNLYAYVGNNPLIDIDADGHTQLLAHLVQFGDDPLLINAIFGLRNQKQEATQTEAEASQAQAAQQGSSTPPVPASSAKDVNEKVIEKENDKFTECVAEDFNKTVIEATADVAQDSAHEASKAAQEGSENSSKPPSPDQGAGTKMTTEIAAAITELHQECLSKHPLAALSPKYRGWVNPGDIGRVPGWLQTLSDFLK